MYDHRYEDSFYNLSFISLFYWLKQNLEYIFLLLSNVCYNLYKKSISNGPGKVDYYNLNYISQFFLAQNFFLRVWGQIISPIWIQEKVIRRKPVTNYIWILWIWWIKTDTQFYILCIVEKIIDKDNVLHVTVEDVW